VQRVTHQLTRIVRGAGISLLGTGMDKVLGIAWLFIISRMLGTEGLGLYYLASSVLGFGLIFSNLGFDEATRRFTAFYNGEGDVARIKGTLLMAARIAIPAGVIIALLLFLASGFLSQEIFHKNGLDRFVKIFALSAPFATISSIMVASTLGLTLMQYPVYSNNLFKPIVMILSVILFYNFLEPVTAVAFSVTVASVLTCGLNCYYASKHIPLFKKNIIAITEPKKILKFSIPQTLTSITGFSGAYLDTLLLGRLSLAGEIGIYSLSLRTAAISLIFIEAFNSIFSPLIAELLGRKEYKELEVLFKVITRWVLTLSLPIFMIIFLFPKELLGIFGGGFTAGSSVLMVLAIGRLVALGTGPVGWLIVMAGYTKLIFLIRLAVLFVSLTLNLVLIPKYGALGAAWACCISVFANNLAGVTAVYYIFRIHPYHLDILKPVFSAMIAVLITSVLKIGTIPSVILCILVYGVSLLIFRLSEYDKLMLNKIKARLMPL